MLPLLSVTHSDETEVIPYQFGCDRWPLHYACRVGNLEQVQYLVEVLKCAVNEVDSHDATPLYLAALTGNEKICRYLLEHGAVCDEDDAARVFYVALTPQLRTMLREWSLSKAQRDPFVDQLLKTFQDAIYADCLLCLDRNRSIYMHTLVLHARCPALLGWPSSSCDRDNKSLRELELPEELRCDCLPSLLEFLYSGRLDVRGADRAERLGAMASRIGLGSITETLEKELEKWDRSKPFRCDIVDTEGLGQDMRQIARVVSTPHNEFESLDQLKQLLDSTDVTVRCHEETWSLNRFRLCPVSDYLDCALNGSFREATEGSLDVSQLVSPEAWKFVVQWMYGDCFLEEASVELCVQVLEFSFAILAPRLAQYVANALAGLVGTDNVWALLELARIHGLEALENSCVSVVARNVKLLAECPELQAVLAEEAAGIVQAGDISVVDVPLAAEIRRVIVQDCRETREEHLELLDYILRQALRSH